MSTMTTVTYYWDDTDADSKGWYVIVQNAYEVLTDSLKRSFPICVNDYSREEGDDLGQQLSEEFPGDEIIAR